MLLRRDLCPVAGNYELYDDYGVLLGLKEAILAIGTYSYKQPKINDSFVVLVPGDASAADVQQRGVPDRVRDGGGGAVHALLRQRPAVDAVLAPRPRAPHTSQPRVAHCLLHHLHIPGCPLVLHPSGGIGNWNPVYSVGRSRVRSIYQMAEQARLARPRLQLFHNDVFKAVPVRPRRR